MMKTSELTSALLDYWVAKAVGATPRIEEWSLGPVCIAKINSFEEVPFSPSFKWSDGGPIIEREGIAIWRGWKQWVANMPGGSDYQGDINYIDTTNQLGISGPTLLIAAMRAYVASKFGKEVPDMP